MTWQMALRADANAEIGAGHFMRCLTLAKACIDRGALPFFFTTTTSPGLREQAAAAGVKLSDIGQGDPDLVIRELLNWVRDHQGAWMVLDGYDFDDTLQSDIARAGGKLMVIDDYMRLPDYHADLLLDQNFGAEDRRYPVAEGCRTLLGPDYALVRPEFVAARLEARRHPARAVRVLVTLGAADPGDHTSLVIDALVRIGMPALDVTVVIGAANSRTLSAREHAEKAGFRVLSDVRDMARLMAEADLAVSSSGTTLWELCCMGLPTITLVIAENQRPAAVALAQAGVTVNLGWHEDVSAAEISEAVRTLCLSPERRLRMTEAGQTLVDGRGVERVVDEMLCEVD